MTTQVQFCGMTREEDIAYAEQLRVDFIGFIFVASSPRSITLDQAKLLRPAVRAAKLVGVFEDISVETVIQYHRALQFDFIEWYDEPDEALMHTLPLPVIQAFRGVPSEALARTFLSLCPYILIDKAKEAETAEFDRIATLPADIRSRTIVAGGLTPVNISEVVRNIHPFAVDCARGIESSPGVKDRVLMDQFMNRLSVIGDRLSTNMTL